MIDFENMYDRVNAKRLHIAFCLESETKSKQSLHRRAVVNATIQSKFPKEMLLPGAMRHMVDLLRAAAQQASDKDPSAGPSPLVARGSAAIGT